MWRKLALGAGKASESVAVEAMPAINVMGLGIERDLYWTPLRLSEVRREVEKQ